MKTPRSSLSIDGPRLMTNLPRRRHYIYFCEISQPQPPGGKKRCILIRSKAHAVGDTSSTEDNTLLTSVARSNTGITYEFLLVPAGPGPKSPVRPLQPLVPAGSGSQSQIRPLEYLVAAGARRVVPGNTACIPDNHQENAFEYSSSSVGVVPRKKPCPSGGNTAAPPSAKEPEKMLNSTSRDAGLYILNSFEANGSKRRRRTLVPLLFIQKKKAKPFGSRSQLPGSRSQLPGSGFQLPGSRSQLPEPDQFLPLGQFGLGVLEDHSTLAMKAQGWRTVVTTRFEHKALQKIISRRVQNLGISPRPLSTSGKLILLQGTQGIIAKKCKSPGDPIISCFSRRGKQQSLALGFSLIPAPSKSDSGFPQKQQAAQELDSG
ncbi:hypothetical protein F2Q69_00030750 [Brassica cretica]|uniref:Uncharacterized protein n=1 Tax=Brassica cretica TaxID=69181 RepID=A0A8S9S2Z5_BRACR|nr:hypothetical protein F2Q69_00030750 [Brassica cretica]